jgi:hypothetical protein
MMTINDVYLEDISWSICTFYYITKLLFLNFEGFQVDSLVLGNLPYLDDDNAQLKVDAFHSHLAEISVDNHLLEVHLQLALVGAKPLVTNKVVAFLHL